MAVAAALALPAIAFAATTHHYSGPVDTGGHVGFGTVKRHHRTYVRDFRWTKVSIHCDQGDTVTTNGFTFSVRVRHGEFHFRGESGNSTARASGEFSHHGTQADGALRIRGRIAANQTNCDTGRRPWHADRTS